MLVLPLIPPTAYGPPDASHAIQPWVGPFDDLFARDMDKGGELLLRHDGRTPALMRARIVEMMEHLLTLKDKHVDMPVEHQMIDGMYLRKIYIPKGALLVGAVHLKACLNIVAKGDISVLTELGAGRLREGASGVSPPGLQKVGLAHADTVFINVFRTDQTDIKAIEMEIASMYRLDGREVACL